MNTSKEQIQKRKARVIGRQKEFAKKRLEKEQEYKGFRNTRYKKEVELFFIQPLFCL